jgi:hypothetical protein
MHFRFKNSIQMQYFPKNLTHTGYEPTIWSWGRRDYNFASSCDKYGPPNDFLFQISKSILKIFLIKTFHFLKYSDVTWFPVTRVSFPKGLHSWSSEQSRYDQPAMKMMRNANRSRRETWDQCQDFINIFRKNRRKFDHFTYNWFSTTSAIFTPKIGQNRRFIRKNCQFIRRKLVQIALNSPLARFI